MSRRTLAVILAIAGAILAAIAFLSAVASGFHAPHWVLPTGVFAVACAVVLSIV